VQNTLLGLGALLLAVAGIVFAAVTYRHLGPVGRLLILLVMTAIAAGAPMALAKRGLTASAEAVGAVAVVLAAVDAWALRQAGVGDQSDPLSYATVATAILALSFAGYAYALPLRVSRLAAVTAAQLPVALLLARTEPPRPVVAVVLAALATGNLLVAGERRLPSDVRGLATGFAGTHLILAVLVSSVAISERDEGSGLGLLAVALVLGACSVLVTDTAARAVLSGTAIPLLAAAAWVTLRYRVAEDELPLVLVGVALIALAGSAVLPRLYRPGPAVGGLLVVLAALVTQAESVLIAFAGPFTWLEDPWSLDVGSARAAVSTTTAWDGSFVTLLVLVVATGCAIACGLLLHREAEALGPSAVLLVLTAAVLPLGLDLSYRLGLAVLIAAAAALAGSALLTSALRRTALLGCAGTLPVLAAVWSVADRPSTLVVLPVLALLAGVLALRVAAVAGVCAGFVGASVGALGADGGLTVAETGVALLAVPLLCVGLAFVLHGVRVVALEIAALILAAIAVVLTVQDAVLLSLALGVSGLLALAIAIRPDRREVALLGGLLLSGSSWVRLADANVEAPEPYAAPLAITALLFGHLRRRGHEGVSSFQAYGNRPRSGAAPLVAEVVRRRVARPRPGPAGRVRARRPGRRRLATAGAARDRRRCARPRRPTPAHARRQRASEVEPLCVGWGGAGGGRSHLRTAPARPLAAAHAVRRAELRSPPVTAIEQLLALPTWAVVGLSDNRSRAAWGVASFLQQKGTRIVPVHPSACEVHGEQGYPSLSDIPFPVDVVDCFVRSELVGSVVDEAIAIGAKGVWMQLGVIDHEAAVRAQAAGLLVVMDVCPKIEWR